MTPGCSPHKGDSHRPGPAGPGTPGAGPKGSSASPFPHTPGKGPHAARARRPRQLQTGGLRGTLSSRRREEKRRGAGGALAGSPGPPLFFPPGTANILFLPKNRCVSKTSLFICLRQVNSRDGRRTRPPSEGRVAPDRAVPRGPASQLGQAGGCPGVSAPGTRGPRLPSPLLGNVYGFAPVHLITCIATPFGDQRVAPCSCTKTARRPGPGTRLQARGKGRFPQ